MINRVTELLRQNNILCGKTELLPITAGAGGAYVFSVDYQYIIKYAYLPALDFEIRKQYRKEFSFYKICSGKNIDFLPEIVFQTANDDEILLVMKKYAPIKPADWDENLQKSAMELCAHINAVDTTDFNALFQEQEKQNDEEQHEDSYPLSLSYQNWVNLQKKFPEHIDAALLKEMYADFDDMGACADKLDIPETLCHGDCHPQNFLKDGDKLKICDWQGAGIGRGIGDVAFFISRGADMGLDINRDKLIEDYCGALLKYANIKVNVSDLHKNVAADEFWVSFRYWAGYLQTSDIDRVLNIYNSMVNSYVFLR